MPIVINLDAQLIRRNMSVPQLSRAIGITEANIFVLKGGRAKAVRFSTLEAICRALDCQPGDLLQWVPDTMHASEGARS